MTTVATNNKTSLHINSQVPFFVRNDHENFVAFLEAYYEFLEQEDGLLSKSKALRKYNDVDEAVDEFSEALYNNFIKALPAETVADKNLLLKYIKDFYRSRGTEKSMRFLIRILFGDIADDMEFYYPKKDILRVSDGKWFIEKSLKFNNSFIDGVQNTNITILRNAMVNKKITGSTSNATAYVERIDNYYDNGTEIKEIKLSNQTKDFESGEIITTSFVENGVTKNVSCNIFSGIINSVTINNAGQGYSINDLINVSSNTGTGAELRVSAVTTGSVEGLSIVYGGAGYQANNLLLITGGGGTGANARISAVDTSNKYHPNSYNVIFTTIELEANTTIGNTQYSNLVAAITDPANAWIQNSMSSFVYANTGPATGTLIISSGNNYSYEPTITAQSNTRITELGILGGLRIVSGGLGYVTGDKIEFFNIPGGTGTGASANVYNVASNGYIQGVRFESITGHIPGGSGYIDYTGTPYLPIANVRSNTGTGANVVVTCILGQGAEFESVSSNIGSILAISIISGGYGYETVPTLSLEDIGNGEATANATIVTGTYTYPGRYLNDDGHISGYNFIEDRDYYQTFSYVLKLRKSIEKYRKYMLDLVHPAGMKLYGEMITIEDGANTKPIQSVNTRLSYAYSANYVSTGNGISNTSNVSIITNQNTMPYTGNIFIEVVSVNEQYSNLTLNTGSGAAVTTINLSRWPANSNIYFTTGHSLNVRGNVVSITNSSYTGLSLTVSPGLPGNIIANSFSVIKPDELSVIAPHYKSSNLRVNTGSGSSVTTINLSGWAANSNIYFRPGYKANINGTESIITSINANTITISSGISGNLISNVIQILEPLEVKNNIYPIMTKNNQSNTIYITAEQSINSSGILIYTIIS